MNKYLDILIDEMREYLGDDACQADWSEFWDTIQQVGKSSYLHASIISGADGDRDELIEEAVELVYEFAEGTRANLPSIKAYIWHEIENGIARND